MGWFLKRPWSDGDVCPEDERDADAFQFVRELYVVPGTGFLESQASWSEVASFGQGIGELLSVGATNEESIRLEYVDSAAEIRVQYVDLWTGASAPIGLLGEMSSNLGKPPGDRVVSQGSATLDEVTLARIRFTAGNGAQLKRMVVETPMGFARAGCARTDEVPFATPDTLWSAYLDNGVVRWGPWEDLPTAVR